MPSPNYDAYKAAQPYFDLVRGALGDIVEGGHFFDVVTDDTVYEVLYNVPGWPRIIQGRTDLMAQFRGYCENIELQSADKLISDARSGVCHSDPHAGRYDRGHYMQHSFPVGYGTHRLDGIHDQVAKDQLQLDSVAHDVGKIVEQFGPNRDSFVLNLGACQQ